MTEVVRVEVLLWNSEESAVAAVRTVLASPPLNAVLEEEGGRFYLVGSAFAAWAAEKQGYVKAVVHRDVKPPSGGTTT